MLVLKSILCIRFPRSDPIDIKNRIPKKKNHTNLIDFSQFFESLTLPITFDNNTRDFSRFILKTAKIGCPFFPFGPTVRPRAR